LRPILLFLVSAVVQSAGAAAAPPLHFERLPNGLEMVVWRDTRTPVVCVTLVIRGGAADETPEKSGVAHLLEHVAYDGSQHVLAETSPIIQGAGGVGDAETDFDFTQYYARVPSNAIEVVMWLHSDRLAWPSLTRDALDKARPIAIREIEQRFGSSGSGRAEVALHAALYPSPHPHHGLVGGTLDHIQNATVEDLRAFHRRFYQPRNVRLLVVGDVTVEEATRLAHKYFGSLKNSYVAPPPPAVPVGPPMPPISITDPSSSPKLLLGWRLSPSSKKDRAALDVLASILGDQRWGLLRRELVGRNGISDAECSIQHYRITSFFLCTITAAQSAGLDAAPLLAALERLQSLIGAKDLDVAKRRRDVKFERELSGLMTRSRELARRSAFYRDSGEPAPWGMFDEHELGSTLTLADVFAARDLILKSPRAEVKVTR
jgi:zinc protease